jgi:CDP-6-deoxy-D-xylo-4-hexulose-3-dehydrase
LSKNVANYIKKKLYKINEKELKEILSELTEYLKENKPKYLYNDAFVPEKPSSILSPYWDEQEIMAGINTFVTGKWVVAGENVHKFESAFAKMFNVKHTHMVNCSSANLVLVAGVKKHFGWEDGDEVIVSPVGFPTTISPLVQNNLVQYSLM